MRFLICRYMGRSMKINNSTYKVDNKNLALTSKIVLLVLLLVCTVGLMGCGKKVPVIHFKVKSNNSVNGGQPVYLLIRTINGPEFVTDDYQTIVDFFNESPLNNTVISTDFIIPGGTKKITVKKPDDRDIAVYCMFTNPEDQWKVLIQKPLEKKYVIRLDNNALLVEH